MKSINVVTFLFVLITLSACGGGGSSSGGEQQKDLTSCVAVSIVESTVTTGSTTLTSREYTYTNNCGVSVNLSTAILTEGSIETIALATTGTFTRRTLGLSLSYIACRPPSAGIDGDAERALLQFACS